MSTQRLKLVTTGYTLADYRNAALMLWGEAGVFAVDEFERINREYFNEELPPLPIVIGLTAYGHVVGLCRREGPWANGELPRISIAPGEFNKRGARSVSDVVLHEMIHAKLILAGLDWQHNAKPWCHEIERLAPLISGVTVKATPVTVRRILNPVTGKKSPKRQALEGHLTQRQLARFPHSLRSDQNHGRIINVPNY